MSKKQDPKTTAVTVRKDAVLKAIGDKSIADSVFNKIVELEDQGGLDLPPNYSPANALKSAWLIFQDSSDLMKCTEGSKANALLDMVIQGLSPSKSQCYFIPYGQTAKLQRSYLGNVAVAKRLTDIEDVSAQAIFEGDEVDFVIKDGIKEITKHEQKFQDINVAKVIGAYAIAFRKNGKKAAEIMTRDQIKAAWEQGAMKGKSAAHTKFTDEMSKKTVINRLVKPFLDTSDDSGLLAESVNRTRSIADIPEAEAEEVIEDQITEGTAQKEIDINPGEVRPEEKKDPDYDSDPDEESVFDKGAAEAKKHGPGY